MTKGVYFLLMCHEPITYEWWTSITCNQYLHGACLYLNGLFLYFYSYVRSCLNIWMLIILKCMSKFCNYRKILPTISIFPWHTTFFSWNAPNPGGKSAVSGDLNLDSFTGRELAVLAVNRRFPDPAKRWDWTSHR